MKLTKDLILSKLFILISLLSFKLVKFKTAFIKASSSVPNCKIPQVLAINKIYSMQE